MSGRLHSVKAGDAIRALQRAGFVVSRTSGSHCRLVRFSDPVRYVTVPMHGGDLKLGTLRAIIRQAGSRLKSSTHSFRQPRSFFLDAVESGAVRSSLDRHGITPAATNGDDP